LENALNQGGNRAADVSGAVLATSVSVIIPTYKESENLPELLKRLNLLRGSFEAFEVIIVDDDSRDGTVELLEQLKVGTWLRIIVRQEDRGLSSAVLRGCREARYAVLVIMDADLSHPPETIVEMVKTLVTSDSDFVVGSRYCAGGSVDAEWTLWRRLNSAAANLLAMPFTTIKDPMSGFFALRRDAFLNAASLNPLGYKIGLEFIVKCGFRKIREISIFFAVRKKGVSKLSFGE